MSGPLVCDFCNKAAADVACLVRGAKSDICDQCIVLCLQILGDKYLGTLNAAKVALFDKVPT